MRTGQQNENEHNKDKRQKNLSLFLEKFKRFDFYLACIWLLTTERQTGRRYTFFTRELRTVLQTEGH